MLSPFLQSRNPPQLLVWKREVFEKRRAMSKSTPLLSDLRALVNKVKQAKLRLASKKKKEAELTVVYSKPKWQSWGTGSLVITLQQCQGTSFQYGASRRQAQKNLERKDGSGCLRKSVRDWVVPSKPGPALLWWCLSEVHRKTCRELQHSSGERETSVKTGHNHFCYDVHHVLYSYYIG